MPSVDELLNVAEVIATGLTETNDKIEIDADTRTMIIPDTERIFGVMSDEKGERKYFRCKRFVGNGIDLSKLSLRIVFQNASGLETGRDKYIVTDLATDGEDYVTFSWELSRKVTAYKGIISFVVCAIKTKSDGTITNEWNTTLANGIVLEGLEADGTQEQEEVARDYYNQLEAELLRVANEQKTEIKNIVKNKVDKPSVNDNNKIPRAKNGDVEWVDVGQPTDEQTNNAVTSWLNEHPEATTTVRDGSIEEIKISKNFLPYIKKDYVTPEMFGAVGDGIQDDTSAFQNAINFLRKMEISKQLKEGYPRLYNHPMLVLKKEYKVTSIDFRNSLINLKGYNGAILHVNEINLSSEIDIENITFIGLSSGIKFNTESDFNVPIIRNCVFFDCNKAINISVLRSASVLIESCKFYNCDMVLYNFSDKCVMRNCFIEAKNYTVPPIYNDGNLVIDSCIFVPTTSIKMETWIENHADAIKQGGLTLVNSRFGSENGGAKSIVHNYAKAITNDLIGDRNNIIIDKCQIACSGTVGVLKLFAIPNRISITNVFGLFDCVNGLITTSDEIELPSQGRFVSGIITDGSFIQSRSYPIVSSNIEYLYNNKYCDSLKRYTMDYEKRIEISKSTLEKTICKVAFDGDYTQGIYEVSIKCLLLGTTNMYISDIYVRVNNKQTKILTEKIIFKSEYFSDNKLSFSVRDNGELVCNNNCEIGNGLVINAKIGVNNLYQGTKTGNGFVVS